MLKSLGYCDARFAFTCTSSLTPFKLLLDDKEYLSAQCRSILECIVRSVVVVTHVYVLKITQVVILVMHTCNPRT